MNSNFSYGNPTHQSRESELYYYPRPYPAPACDHELSEEDYNPEDIQNHAENTPSSRLQAPSTSLPDQKALHQSNAVKFHVKTLGWSFDFEGPYIALHKILESLESITEQLLHRE